MRCSGVSAAAVSLALDTGRGSTGVVEAFLLSVTAGEAEATEVGDGVVGAGVAKRTVSRPG